MQSITDQELALHVTTSYGFSGSQAWLLCAARPAGRFSFFVHLCSLCSPLKWVLSRGVLRAWVLVSVGLSQYLFKGAILKFSGVSLICTWRYMDCMCCQKDRTTAMGIPTLYSSLITCVTAVNFCVNLGKLAKRTLQIKLLELDTWFLLSCLPFTVVIGLLTALQTDLPLRKPWTHGHGDLFIAPWPSQYQQQVLPHTLGLQCPPCLLQVGES